MLHSTSVLLKPGTQASNRSIRILHLVPSHLSNAKTCRITLPIGTSAEGCHAHTQYRTCLDSWKLSRARVCMSVFSTHLLSPSVSWRNAGLYWGWRLVPLSGLCLQRWNKPWPHYGLLVFHSNHGPNTVSKINTKTATSVQNCKFFPLRVRSAMLPTLPHTSLARNCNAGIYYAQLCYRPQLSDVNKWPHSAKERSFIIKYLNLCKFIKKLATLIELL